MRYHLIGRGCLAAMVLGGAFLRFHALDRQSLWDDEMSTLKMISLPYSQWPERFKTHEGHPPLYFLQLRLWKRVFGDSLGALRSNSALWGTISLAAFFCLAQHLGLPSSGGLLAVGLLTFSPFHLAYSQELRPYAMAGCLAILGFWAMEGIRRNPHRHRGWILWFLLMAAELYSHYWGAFVATAQTLYGLCGSHDRRFRGKVLVLSACAAGLFLFWFPVLRHQANLVGHNLFWASPPGVANLGHTFLAFSGLRFRCASSAFQWGGSDFLTGIVIIVYTIGLALGARRAPGGAKFWLACGLGLPFALSFWKPPLYVWYRYTVLVHPAFLLWVSSGLSAFRAVWIRRLSLGALILAGSWGCHRYFSGWEKANPKAVVEYVTAQSTPQTMIVRPAYFADLFSYYYRGQAPVIDQHTLDSAERRRKLAGHQILLVAFDVSTDPIAEALRSEFKVVASQDFPGYARLGITVYTLI